MASPAKFRCSKPTFHLHINLQHRSHQNFSFPFFPTNLTKSTPVRFPVVRASSSPSNPKPSLLKTTCITLTAAAALFSASFYLVSKPTASTPTTTYTEIATFESHSNDVESIKIHFESKNCDQSIVILNRLIELEPYEQRWMLMKARIMSYRFHKQSTIKTFEEILSKDTNCVEAYHYLVMENYYSKPKLKELEMRILNAIERCKKKKKKKKKEIRDLRLLIAQIRFMEGNSVESIQICEELVKDDPKDFKVYAFQGLVYIMMKKFDEADKQFKQCEKMLPENHPIREYFMNSEKESDWRFIVAYSDIFCYLTTFINLVVASSLGKLGVDLCRRFKNQPLEWIISFVGIISWVLRG